MLVTNNGSAEQGIVTLTINVVSPLAQNEFISVYRNGVVIAQNLQATNGTLTFTETLPPGTYSYQAACGNGTVANTHKSPPYVITLTATPTPTPATTPAPTEPFVLSWNPNDAGPGVDFPNYATNDYLTVTSNANNMVRATRGISSGKWYWTNTTTNINILPILGVATLTTPLTGYPGKTGTTAWGYYGYQPPPPALDLPGSIIENNDTPRVYGLSWRSTSDVIGILLDMDAGTMTVYKNGVSMGVAVTGLTGTVYPAMGGASPGAGSNVTTNFSASLPPDVLSPTPAPGSRITLTGKLSIDRGCEYPVYNNGYLFGIYQTDTLSQINVFDSTNFAFVNSRYVGNARIFCPMIYAAGSLYLACATGASANTPDTKICRIEASPALTIQASADITLNHTIYGVVYASGFIWVLEVSTDGLSTSKLKKLNATTMALIDTISIISGATSLKTDGTNLWYSSTGTYKVNGITGATMTSFATVTGRNSVIVGQFIYYVYSDPATYVLYLKKVDKDTGVVQPFAVALPNNSFGNNLNFVSTDGRYVAAGQELMQVIDTTTDTTVGSISRYVNTVVSGTGTRMNSWAAGFPEPGKLIVTDTADYFIAVGPVRREYNAGFAEYSIT